MAKLPQLVPQEQEGETGVNPRWLEPLLEHLKLICTALFPESQSKEGTEWAQGVTCHKGGWVTEKGAALQPLPPTGQTLLLALLSLSHLSIVDRTTQVALCGMERQAL